MVRSCPHALDDHPQLKPCFPSRMGDGAPIREGRILGGGAREQQSGGAMCGTLPDRQTQPGVWFPSLERGWGQGRSPALLTMGKFLGFLESWHLPLYNLTWDGCWGGLTRYTVLFQCPRWHLPSTRGRQCVTHTSVDMGGAMWGAVPTIQDPSTSALSENLLRESLRQVHAFPPSSIPSSRSQTRA